MTDPTAPRLADRLSALVGQAATRQEEPASSERVLTAVSERLAALGAEVGDQLGVVHEQLAELGAQVAGLHGRIEGLGGTAEDADAHIEALDGHLTTVDAGLRGHVDEVGGALVVRLDEVASTLGRAVSEAEQGLRDSVTETAGNTAGLLDIAPAIGELALRLEDVSTGLTESVTAQGEGVLAELRSLTAVSDATADRVETLAGDVAALDAGLTGLQGELVSVQESLARRIDEAALALAETLVALLTGSAPATAGDDAYEPAAGDLTGADLADGYDGYDETAADLSDAGLDDLADPGLDPAQLDAQAVEQEEELQAVGIDEGGATEALTSDSATPVADGGAGATNGTASAPTKTATRKRGLFHR